MRTDSRYWPAMSRCVTSCRLGERRAESLSSRLTQVSLLGSGFVLPEGESAGPHRRRQERCWRSLAQCSTQGARQLLPNQVVPAFVNTLSDSALATAGSGDVLSGLLGSLLAAETARSGVLTEQAAAQAAACAALIHGRQVASLLGRGGQSHRRMFVGCFPGNRDAAKFGSDARK